MLSTFLLGMYRSMLERALLLNIPLRVGDRGGMRVCFTCASPAAISGSENGVRQSVQQANTACFKIT